MPTYTLTIEGWHPARLNDLLRGHWSRGHRLKKADRQIVGLAARLQGIPPATGKRRVSLTITLGPRQRAGDVDAYQKSLLDSLVQAGLLTDDNRQGVELAPVQFERGPGRSTTIIL